MVFLTRNEEKKLRKRKFEKEKKNENTSSRDYTKLQNGSRLIGKDF